MKTITVNLKLLYQNGEIWAWYFISVVSILHILSPQLFPRPTTNGLPPNRFDLLAPVLVLTILGYGIGRLMADIWTKPISFSLPRQRKISRNILLFIGLVAAIITSLIITTHYYWMAVMSLSVIISLFSFYLMIYCLSVITSILINRVVFIVPFLILFTIPLMNNLMILSAIQDLILIYPWISAFICWMINCLIYYAVGSRYLARYICGSPSVIFFAGLETVGSNGYNSMRLTKDSYIEKFTGLINRFFIKRIRSNNQSSILPHLWGRIYIILGYFISKWRLILFDGPIVFLCIAIFITSVQFDEFRSFLYCFIGLLAAHISVISGSDILLPLERRVRLFSEITSLITALLIMLGFTALFYFLIKIFPYTITSFMKFDPSPELTTFHVKYIFFSMTLLPTTVGLLILFRKKSFLSIVFITLIVISLLGAHYHMIKNGKHIFNIFDSFVVISVIVISSGFYLPIIYYNSMKR